MSRYDWDALPEDPPFPGPDGKPLDPAFVAFYREWCKTSDIKFPHLGNAIEFAYAAFKAGKQ